MLIPLKTTLLKKLPEIISSDLNIKFAKSGGIGNVLNLKIQKGINIKNIPIIIKLSIFSSFFDSF